MNEKFVGVKGLVASEKSGDDELLLNLRQNVFYSMLQDDAGPGGTGKILAKVIDVSNQKTYKPKNNTSAILLYVLARDNDAPVLQSDYFKFLKDNLPPSLTSGKINNVLDAVRSFLHKLETQYKILDVKVVPQGTQGTNDLDPVGMVGSLSSFDYDLDLIPGNAPICKKNTHYSTGYKVTIR